MIGYATIRQDILTTKDVAKGMVLRDYLTSPPEATDFHLKYFRKLRQIRRDIFRKHRRKHR
jgi:hypothetical protein